MQDVVGRAADEIPARRDGVGQPARPVRDVEDSVRGKRQRQHRQRMSWIAHERRRRQDQESDRERDVEADALQVVLRDRKADVGAGGQREEQRGELAESELRDQAIGRRWRDA